MRDTNQVLLVGNLGQDAEYREHEGRKITTLSLATNRKVVNARGEETSYTEWHRVVCWGWTAEATKALHKGQRIAVTGEIRTRSWEDEGVKRWATEIVSDGVAIVCQTPKPATT